MKSYLIEMFGISLALTIAAELAVIRLLFPVFRQNHGKGTLLVTLVNILTNPPAVLLCWLGGLYMPEIPKIAVQLVVELAVIMVEAGIYWSFARKSQWKIHRPVRLAVTANACSWLLGAIFTL